MGRQDHRRRPAGNDASPAPVCTLTRRSSDLTGKLTTCLTALAEQACFITARTINPILIRSFFFYSDNNSRFWKSFGSKSETTYNCTDADCYQFGVSKRKQPSPQFSALCFIICKLAVDRRHTTRVD
ncbi:hypothetical protein T12_13133 [Trichinella patagoniensis]|uniref:Uncharacterized protein n=1 Tax=Trichinella patagoniensis TaxID=990121 RepID=A0A0V1A4S4_9BILA|nr:hypothetical protein T12_13133 [Trichinella patagoniensis]